jgi:hypothetical protein
MEAVPEILLGGRAATASEVRDSSRSALRPDPLKTHFKLHDDLLQ